MNAYILRIHHIQTCRHLPLMGPVLMAVLAEVSADAWCNSSEKAWSAIWIMVCETMTEALSNGLEYGAASQVCAGCQRVQCITLYYHADILTTSITLSHRCSHKVYTS